MPRVSVVIPAYEPGQLLRRAIASVCAQTVPEFELIVIDDGGSEDLSWVDRTSDDRIVRIVQRNFGVSIARNVGLGLAASPLVAFLDQDDEWMPTKLEVQLTAMAATECVLSYTGFVWNLRDGRALEQQYRGSTTYLQLLREEHICLSSIVVRRAEAIAVGGFDPLLRIYQDFDFALRLSRFGGTFSCVPEPLVQVHLHAGNGSLDYRNAFHEGIDVLRRHAAMARVDGDAVLMRAAATRVERMRTLHGIQAFDEFRFGRQPRDLAFALKHAPSYTTSTMLKHAAVVAKRAIWSTGPTANRTGNP